MARVTTVKHARKDFPEFGIKKGDTYYWWAFRFGPTVKSKTYPKPSQLTRSAFLQKAYGLQEEVDALAAEEGIQESVEDIVARIRDLASQYEESLSNMPEQLQQAETGELLQERADGCNQWADELEQVDFDVDTDGITSEVEQERTEESTDEEVENLVQEKLQERYDEILSEVQNVSCPF